MKSSVDLVVGVLCGLKSPKNTSKQSRDPLPPLPPSREGMTGSSWYLHHSDNGCSAQEEFACALRLRRLRPRGRKRTSGSLEVGFRARTKTHGYYTRSTITQTLHGTAIDANQLGWLVGSMYFGFCRKGTILVMAQRSPSKANPPTPIYSSIPPQNHQKWIGARRSRKVLPGSH